MTRKFTYGGLLIILLLGAIAAWMRQPTPASQTSVNPAISIGGPFSLIDQNGERRSQDDFAGSYMLVNFGFTFCPDVCPTALRDMSAAIDQLGADGEKVIPVFITIDPERDTVEKLKPYAAHFHPRLVALTGSSDEIAAAAKAYRVYYARADIDLGSEDYLMDHSSLYYLMGPDGKYIRHFSHGTPPDEMAAAIAAQL